MHLKKGLDLKVADDWKITLKAVNCDVAGAVKEFNEINESVKVQFGSILHLPPAMIKTECFRKVDNNCQ
jgi:hypothetical protein